MHQKVYSQRIPSSPWKERFGAILGDSLGFHEENPSLQEPEKVMNGTEANRLQEQGHCTPTHHTLQNAQRLLHNQPWFSPASLGYQLRRFFPRALKGPICANK